MPPTELAAWMTHCASRLVWRQHWIRWSRLILISGEQPRVMSDGRRRSTGSILALNVPSFGLGALLVLSWCSLGALSSLVLPCAPGERRLARGFIAFLSRGSQHGLDEEPSDESVRQAGLPWNGQLIRDGLMTSHPRTRIASLGCRPRSTQLYSILV